MSIPTVGPSSTASLGTYFDQGFQRRGFAMSGAYTGARYDRKSMLVWPTSSGSADADTIPDLPTLRSRSRDLMRNNPLAKGAIDTVVLNAAGTGLALQPTPDIETLEWTPEQGRAWGKGVARKFARWAESTDSDVTRTTNFYDAQTVVMRSELESGDAFTLLTQLNRPGAVYKTCFQIIEADRVRTPGSEGMAAVNTLGDATSKNGNTIFGGIEQDEYGAPVAYCILKQHPGSLSWTATSLTDYTRYLAFGAKTGRRNVLHHFDRLRPDQSRGVPYLAPVIELFKQLGRYTDAEVTAAVVTAMYTVFVTTDSGDVSGSLTGETSTPPGQGEIALAPGAVIGLQPDQNVTFPNSMRPNAGYDPFVTSILRQIGVGLGLPFEVLIKHFTASYSAARASLLEAWKFFRNRRNHLALGFCQPVFEAWMDEAVSAGYVAAPGYFASPLLRRAFLSADWIGDAPGQIDPLKEVQAAKMRVDEGLSDRKSETMALSGRDWEDVHVNNAREHQLRAAAGLEPEVMNAAATEMVPDDADQADATEDAQNAQPEPPETPQPPAKPAKKAAAKRASAKGAKR